MIENFYPYLLNAMTGSSTQSPDAQREDGRWESSWQYYGSSPRAVAPTAIFICPVSVNVSSTLQEHSISVLTKCRARLWIQVVPRKHFRPGQTSPGRFLLYSELWELLYSVLSRISAAPFCPCISQYTAQKFICLVCICRSRVDLSAWKSALFRKISLSEPHLRRVWDFSERF